MERYERYKDSGVEWIGEIPEGWEVRKLKYIANLKSGNNLTSSQIKDSGKYPVYGGNGLRGYYSDYTHEGEFVLIGRQGALCGNINYASGKFWPTDHAVVVHEVFKYERVWLGELLRTMNLNQYSVAAAQPGLAVETIKNLTIPYPKLKIQTAIANYLDRKTAEIDELIAQKERLIELYEEKKTAIINQAVTKGIDPDAKLKDSGVDWLGEIPEGWDIKRLRYFTSYFKGNAFKSSDFRIEGIPIVKASNIKNKTIVNVDSFISFDNQRDEFERVKLQEGDIIVSTVGSKPEVVASAVGQLAGVNGIFAGSYLNQNTLCIRPISCVKASFLKYAFFSNYMRVKFDAASLWIANQAYLEVESIRNIELPFPRQSEQTAIVNHIENETARINAKIAKTKRIIELQKEYRTALISEVVTGKIKVTEEPTP